MTAFIQSAAKNVEVEARQLSMAGVMSRFPRIEVIVPAVNLLVCEL